MKNYIFILLFLFLGTQAHAAFPAKTATTQHATEQNFHQFVNNAVEKMTGKPANALPKPPISKGRGESGWEGIASFSLAVVGAILAFTPAALLGLLMLIGAVVLGAMGFNKPNRGFALAGFIIGAAFLLIMIIGLLFVAASL